MWKDPGDVPGFLTSEPCPGPGPEGTYALHVSFGGFVVGHTESLLPQSVSPCLLLEAAVLRGSSVVVDVALALLQ